MKPNVLLLVLVLLGVSEVIKAESWHPILTIKTPHAQGYLKTTSLDITPMIKIEKRGDKCGQTSVDYQLTYLGENNREYSIPVKQLKTDIKNGPYYRYLTVPAKIYRIWIKQADTDGEKCSFTFSELVFDSVVDTGFIPRVSEDGSDTLPPPPPPAAGK